MKDARPTFMGHLKSASNLTTIIFTAVRQDILGYLSPFSQSLERQTILVPGAITAMKSFIQVITRISKILNEKGTASFYIADLFPTLSKLIWPNLEDDTQDSLPVCRTRKDDLPTTVEKELFSKTQAYYGYSMTTTLDSAVEKVISF